MSRDMLDCKYEDADNKNMVWDKTQTTAGAWRWNREVGK